MNEPVTQRQLKAYTRSALIGYAILALGLLGSVAYTAHETGKQTDAVVQSGRVVSVDGCNRDFRTLKQAIELVDQRTSNLKKLTAPEKKNTEAYRRALASSAEIRQVIVNTLPDCRVAAKIVTANPSNIGQASVPLHQ